MPQDNNFRLGILDKDHSSSAILWYMMVDYGTLWYIVEEVALAILQEVTTGPMLATLTQVYRAW